MSVLGSTASNLKPQGVSIVVALKESHFSIHTWPEHGAAIIDLFTCGDTQLKHHLSLIAGTFKSDLADSVNVKWSLIRRGIVDKFFEYIFGCLLFVCRRQGAR